MLLSRFSHWTPRWREMDSNFRFPDAPSGRSAEARTFSSDREFAPLAWRDRDFEPPALAGWISALERGRFQGHKQSESSNRWPLSRGTERCYGAGGEDMATSSLHLTMECRDAP